ncbi:MAG: hypothetical protein LBD58_06680 [Treponema sp.]|nr:hypothetical protein [Treponema sp.]
MANWLPETRERHLNIAKVWATAIQNKGAVWQIPTNILPELQTSITESE